MARWASRPCPTRYAIALEYDNLGFQRNRITLGPALRRSADGERLSERARHAEAYAAFQEAAQMDAFDPHSRYLSGQALLHLGRPAEAATEYEA